MLPDLPACCERTLGATIEASSVTKSPMLGAKLMGIKLAFCSQSADDFMTSLRCIRGDTVDASVTMALIDMVDTARRTRAIDARPADRIGRLLVLRRELPRIAVTTRLGMPIRRENRRLDFLFFSFFR